MKDRKPTLSKLKNTDPKRYAELCEDARCYGEAIKYYSQSVSPIELIHAAELAYAIGRTRQVRMFCKKAKESADLQVTMALKEIQVRASVENSPSTGYSHAQDTKNFVDRSIARLLE